MLYKHYIARQLVHSTLLITVSLTSIVWLMQALRFVDFIVNQGVSILVFLKLTLLLVPSLLLIVLPPAFFCAVIFTYNKLRADSELVVMQAMGISSWRLTLPALRVALLFMLIAYSISLYLQPISYRAFKDLQVFLRNNYVSILLQEGVFSSPVDGLTVFIRERNDDGLLKGIIVHDARTAGTAVTMMADEGTLVQTPQGPRFLLKDGNRQEEQDGKLSYLTYDSYALDISLYTNVMGERQKDAQEMFLFDLLKSEVGLDAREQNKRSAEFHQRLLWPAYVPTLALIAMAIFLSGSFNRRGGVKRIMLIVLAGVVLLFSAVGIRGVVAKYPDWSIILYIWWMIPTLGAWYLLRREELMGRTATA